jgi:hypothetical protein
MVDYYKKICPFIYAGALGLTKMSYEYHAETTGAHSRCLRDECALWVDTGMQDQDILGQCGLLIADIRGMV